MEVCRIMARPIYAVNLTASGVSINDLSGLYIDPYGTVDLRLFFSIDEIDQSEDLLTAISGGLVVLNDGDQNLTLEESLNISSVPTFYDVPEAFLDLIDTPSTYAGYQNHVVTVIPTESGVQFANTLSNIGFDTTVSGVYPVEEYDLATKEYVDDVLASGVGGFSTGYQLTFFKHPETPWCEISEKNYMVVSRIAFLGSEVTSVSNLAVTVMGDHDSDPARGYIQVYDVTNINSILEVYVPDLYEDVWQTLTWDNVVSNLPTGEAVLEIRARFIDGYKKWYLNNFILY
jgi:hypothetical protein